jgi:peptidoglycan/xylan/chitin deacetylase (PgdA/CDA1 family)
MDFSVTVLRTIFPSALFSTTSDHIHLTFDDGPHPIATSLVLDILKEHGIRATFFLLGERVRQYPALARRIATEEHSVGSHSDRHFNLLFRKKEFILREIVSAGQSIFEATGRNPGLFRPPYGFYDYRILNAARSQGMKLVHWSIDSRDFKQRNNAGRLERVIEKAKKGSIVLLHDNDTTADTLKTSLPRIIAGLRKRGFTFAELKL